MITGQRQTYHGPTLRTTNMRRASTIRSGMSMCIDACNARLSLGLAEWQRNALVEALSGVVLSLPFSGSEYQRRGARDRKSLYGKPMKTNEVRCLLGVAHGLTNAEIGVELLIPENTCKTHLRNAYRKLGAANAPHAIVLAIKKGIITVEQIDQDLGAATR